MDNADLHRNALRHFGRLRKALSKATERCPDWDGKVRLGLKIDRLEQDYKDFMEAQLGIKSRPRG